MKRLLYCIFLCTAFVLTGCGDDNPYMPEPTPTPSVPKENIVFNLDNNFLRAGASATGGIVFNLDSCYIRGGKGKGDRHIYTIRKWTDDRWDVYVE
jgi:hypothetical protein